MLYRYTGTTAVRVAVAPEMTDSSPYHWYRLRPRRRSWRREAEKDSLVDRQDDFFADRTAAIARPSRLQRKKVARYR
ncbi:hypothetical protein D8S78_02640 [Natrialba swarupiae]|nr:hypothetical protein [Natrialba swarupiae]